MSLNCKLSAFFVFSILLTFNLKAQDPAIHMAHAQYENLNGTQYRTIFVWNSKTGKTARYYHQYDEDAWEKSEKALPDNPLGKASTEVGEIMMDYNQYENHNGTQYRTVYVWNTRTGKSARYYYEYDKKEWKKSTVNLPDNPLGEPTSKIGEVMMDYEQYENHNGTQYRTVYVWNTLTGKSARYYYEHDDYVWQKSKVNLPDKPLD
jgi:hypothetical protein